jgi:hypothetical protein
MSKTSIIVLLSQCHKLSDPISVTIFQFLKISKYKREQNKPWYDSII